MTDDRVIVIAEAGVNHNGSLDLALRLVDAAADAGADVVKFQTFKASELASQQAAPAEYQKRHMGHETSQLEMLRGLELGEAEHRAILAHCEARGVRFLSTPFDLPSLRLLVEGIGVDQIKLGSGELTNAPLLLHAARSGRPIILSTGMGTLDEIEAALGVLAYGYRRSNDPPSRAAFADSFAALEGQEALTTKVTLLHCTTEYPAPFADVNLRAMETMRAAFGLPVGFSDHTPGISIALAAAARGAVVIEKHVTLDRGMKGPDHMASLEPSELQSLVAGIREIEQALGSPNKVPAPSELKNIAVARKCLVAARPILAGETFTMENVAVKRPGTGISPMEIWDLIGKAAPRAFAADETIT